MSTSIKTHEDIEKIRNWYKSYNDKVHDFHLLYFDLGINTCYTPDELQSLKWSDIINQDGTVVDFIFYNGYQFFLNNKCRQSIVEYRSKYIFNIVSEYIFAVGEKLISYAAFNKMLMIASKECGLPYNVSAITLRKTFAYWQIDLYKYDYKKLCQLQGILGNTRISLEDTFKYADYPIDIVHTYINEQLL